MKHSRTTAFWVFAAQILIPLLLGLLIYLLFRPDTHVSRFFYQYVKIRPFDLPAAPFFATLLRSYLCDMLWAYSLTVAVFAVFSTLQHAAYYTLPIVCLFEIAIESLQKLGIISGIFDVRDIVLELLASALALTLLQTRKKETSS